MSNTNLSPPQPPEEDDWIHTYHKLLPHWQSQSQSLSQSYLVLLFIYFNSLRFALTSIQLLVLFCKFRVLFVLREI